MAGQARALQGWQVALQRSSMQDAGTIIYVESLGL